jgi:hypothetical protein
MFMKAEQLSTKAGILTEFQVTQNKQLKTALVSRSATQKKILKMKDDPTISMKTKGHTTK